MVRRLAPILLVAVALFAAGCSASLEKRLVGTYTASFEQPASSANDAAAQMARNFAQMLGGSTTLQLKEDKTFEMTLMALPIQGTWSLDGTRLLLKAESVMGLTPDQLRNQAAAQGKMPPNAGDMDKPLEFEVDPSTLTLKSKQSNASQMAMVFKRKE
ncbi:MAG: hypothetical protein WHU10_09255 [Fimbriimonadales bacterium]